MKTFISPRCCSYCSPERGGVTHPFRRRKDSTSLVVIRKAEGWYQKSYRASIIPVENKHSSLHQKTAFFLPRTQQVLLFIIYKVYMFDGSFGLPNKVTYDNIIQSNTTILLISTKECKTSRSSTTTHGKLATFDCGKINSCCILSSYHCNQYP